MPARFTPSFLIAVLLACSAMTSLAQTSQDSRFDGPAELPRTHVNSSLADTPAPGKTRKVDSSEALQSALDQSSCGDTISLQTGKQYIGKFSFPRKNCDDKHWIIIRSGASDSALPPEGTRITPCYAGVTSLPARPAFTCASTQRVIAMLSTDKSDGPIELAEGANHYRIGPGLEITRAEGTGINYVLINKKEKDAAVDHIILDRDWIHGTAQDETTRGINLSGFTYAAIVDSYFSDFHCAAGIGACVDSQAISGGSGNTAMGTWKIANNFLEAAAEDILFGGAAGATTPTDIEILHNHFFKPLTWMPGQPGFVGAVNRDPSKCVRFKTPGFCPFVVKNLLEFKNAQRVLVEGNILENTWPGFTQHGAAILFTALSQGGANGNPNATVADITFRYNRLAHAASGVVIAEAAYQWGPPKLEARISIHDDIFDDLSPAYYNGDSTAVGLAFQMSQCPDCTPLQGIKIDHVTMLLESPKRLLLLGAQDNNRIRDLTFTNNVVSTPEDGAVMGTGPKAPCAFKGGNAVQKMSDCVASLRFEGNALIGARDSWPRGNSFPRNMNEVKFNRVENGNGGDYRLSPASPHKHAGVDKLDPGADVDAVEKATAGAE